MWVDVQGPLISLLGSVDVAATLMNQPREHVRRDIAWIHCQRRVETLQRLRRLSRSRIEMCEPQVRRGAFRVELNSLQIGRFGGGDIAHIGVHVSQKLLET